MGMTTQALREEMETLAQLLDVAIENAMVATAPDHCDPPPYPADGMRRWQADIASPVNRLYLRWVDAACRQQRASAACQQRQAIWVALQASPLRRSHLLSHDARREPHAPVKMATLAQERGEAVENAKEASAPDCCDPRSSPVDSECLRWMDAACLQQQGNGACRQLQARAIWAALQATRRCSRLPSHAVRRAHHASGKIALATEAAAGKIALAVEAAAGSQTVQTAVKGAAGVNLGALAVSAGGV